MGFEEYWVLKKEVGLCQSGSCVNTQSPEQEVQGKTTENELRTLSWSLNFLNTVVVTNVGKLSELIILIYSGFTWNF